MDIDISHAYKAIRELLSWKNRHLPDGERWEKMRSILEENPGVVLEQDERGETLLHCAAMCSSPEQCMVLLEFDPTRESLQLRNIAGILSIHYACIACNLETARYLLGLHPDGIIMTDNEERNCLHMLFWGNRLMVMGQVDQKIIDFVGFLLEHSPGLISSSTRGGNLPLHFACKEGHSLSVIQFLYNLHPEAMYTRNSAGRTPLAEAQASDEYADDDVRDAVISFFQDQLAIISEARTATTPDNRGQLAIHRAMLNVNLPVGTVKLMIDAKLDSVFIADMLGQNPLHIACQHCNMDVIRYLVEICEHTLKINDASGEIPLHIACRYGRFDVVKWFLQISDAGLSVENGEGKIPIQLLLYEADCDRSSLEYMQAVNVLLRGYPEAAAYLCG